VDDDGEGLVAFDDDEEVVNDEDPPEDI